MNKLELHIVSMNIFNIQTQVLEGSKGFVCLLLVILFDRTILNKPRKKMYMFYDQ